VTETVVPRLADHEAREIIANGLDRNLLVEAAAGTGKTTELVNRIVAVLADGRAQVDSIVAVTFTEKAAGELKLRMRAELENARSTAASDPARHDRLEKALARLEEARVGTIHGFCADLLRERSVEAEVDPKFETMTEGEAERVYSEAFRFWLQEKLEDPPEGVRRSLRRTSYSQSGEGPVGRLRLAGWTLAEWRDFPAPWRRPSFPREARVDELVERVHAFADLTGDPAKRSDNFYLDTERARRLSRELRTAEGVRGRDYDGVEAALIELGSWKFGRPRKGYGKSYGEGVPRAQAHDAHRSLYEALVEFARDADADLAALLQHELLETIDRYERLKQRSGRLDFVDLLIRARNLIRDNDDVRADFQTRFTHVFVDEFQDTDPLQAEILLLLAADDAGTREWRDVSPAPGKLFLVADPKQSIYRFRRADVSIYLDVKRQLAACGAECLHLTTSFRAVPGIQNAVNTVFPAFMDGDPDSHQSEYVALSAFRDEVATQPSVVALPVPRPYGYRGVTKGAIEASLPDAVGAYVDWLLNHSGWTVTERENPGERVPITARHVCLLFRRLDSFFAGDVTRSYVQALEARGIRHLLVGGRSFHEREEVETIRTALSAIEWPDDELSVFATLKGSLFAIGDEELLEYRHLEGRRRPLHPLRRRREELPAHLAPIREALNLLGDLHRVRNRRPIAETINLLLESTRAHAGFALRPSGEQALANVLHVAEQARSYESSGGISFRGFLERLIEDAEGRKAGEAPILEEGSEGVRIMTVHKAKGLEFPVVVLADITADLARNTASRTIDSERKLCGVRIAGWAPADLLDAQEQEVRRDRAEGIRIAYVAATRARDLLVVPAVGDQRFGEKRDDDTGAVSPVGWVSPLNDAIYPPPAAWREADDAPGCPKFGKETTLDRPHDDGSFSGVRPGRHGDVVWWDPATLRLDAPPLYGVRREELMSKDAKEADVKSDVRRHTDWASERSEAIERAAAPSLRVQTATERAGLRTDSQVPDVEVIELPREAGRPAGPRFGALVHAVLATAPLGADADGVRRATELQARILGAAPDEIAATRRAVENVFAHPVMVRAQAAEARGDCRRETPVTFQEDDGTIVDGVVDLAFREEDRWTVIDFKTDRELEKELPVYRRQVGLYAEVIAAATGQGTSALLLSV
jgi:ATP-dependent exoDNAse (exonuclease V) beta subunit